MISSTTILVATVLLNVASGYGAPLRITPSRSIETRGKVDSSVSADILRRVNVEDNLGRSFLGATPLTHGKGKRKEPPVPRENGAAVQNNRPRRYPRRVYYEHYEKRVEDKQVRDTKSVVLDARHGGHGGPGGSGSCNCTNTPPSCPSGSPEDSPQNPPEGSSDDNPQNPPEGGSDGTDSPPPGGSSDGTDSPPPGGSSDGTDSPPPGGSSDGTPTNPPEGSSDGTDSPPPEGGSDGTDSPPPGGSSDGTDSPPPGGSSDGTPTNPSGGSSDGTDSPPPGGSSDGTDSPPPGGSSDGTNSPPPEGSSDGTPAGDTTDSASGGPSTAFGNNPTPCTGLPQPVSSALFPSGSSTPTNSTSEDTSANDPPVDDPPVDDPPVDDSTDDSTNQKRSPSKHRKVVGARAPNPEEDNPFLIAKRLVAERAAPAPAPTPTPAPVTGSTTTGKTKRDTEPIKKPDNPSPSVDARQENTGPVARSPLAIPTTAQAHNRRKNVEAAKRWVKTASSPVPRNLGHSGAVWASAVRRYGVGS